MNHSILLAVIFYQLISSSIKSAKAHALIQSQRDGLAHVAITYVMEARV